MTLSDSKLSRGVPASDLAKLRRLATEASYRGGEYIFREGDPGDVVYVVKSGWVQIVIRSESGQRLLLSRIPPGGIFGEMAMLDAQPRSATACVEDPTVIFRISCRELLAMIEESPPLALAVMRAMVMQQVGRIQNLVNDILEFTRGTTTGATLTEADYTAFVKSVAAELETEAKLNNIHLVLEAPTTPVAVAFHAHRLERVFHNLVHNAVQAMPDGGQITIHVQPVEGWVLTEIADNGPGLPAELGGRLFDPFVTHGKSTGTGLRLSICRKAIQEHGGEITARNHPGGGAVFSFTLPRRG